MEFTSKSTLFKEGKDGSVYTADGKTLLHLASREDQKSYIVPDGVERIAVGATNDLRMYNGTLSLPDSLKYIGDDNFCSITLREGETLVLPENLKYIGSRCFMYVTVSKIRFPSSVQHMGEDVLYGTNNNRCYDDYCKEGRTTLIFAGTEKQLGSLFANDIPGGLDVQYDN